MKKFFFIIILTSVSSAAFGQFVNGLGFYAAGMASRHKYTDNNSPEVTGSHKGKMILRPGGGIVGEFFPGNVKWRTEFEYTMVGSKELIADPQSADGATKRVKNKLDYICWNNFMRIQLETHAGFPYILAGGRVQYLFRNKPEAYVPIMNDLKKFHFSWDVGGGYEFMAYGPARFFAEYHFVSDIPALYKKDNVKVRNITHELRAGIMFRLTDKRERCNAPIYNDPY